jgi:creatinine amidohydrolase
LGTYLSLIRDILDALSGAGFRKVLFVNGHGGNAPASSLASEWVADNPGHKVKTFNWWIAPKTSAKIREIDPVGSHASWMENFPWTRLPGVAVPDERKAVFEKERKAVLDPASLREVLGDGNYGGVYQRSDEEMMAIWQVAVAEAREAMEEGWG